MTSHPELTGKEILLKAIASEVTPRTPWVPFVGVHGGALVGVNAETYLKSADLITQGVAEAVRRYRPDGIPVVFDLQLEAEVLGCDLVWAEQTPPSVASHPLGDDYDLASLPGFSVEKGRIPVVMEAVRRCRDASPDVALYGLLTGPLTLALHLRGDEVLLDMFDEEDGVFTLLAHCTEIAIAMSKAYLDAGADVIAVVDPMISQIGVSHFSGVVAPYLNRIFDAIRDMGGRSSLFVCGNATRNLDAMASTSCDNVSVDENVDIRELAAACRKHGKSFGGNLQLTVVLLLGNEDDARRNTVQCLDAAAGSGHILAPGCDLPYAVPPANLEAVANLVHDPYLQRIARALPPRDESDAFEDVIVPAYATHSQVIVDVVTLDSAGCAPCAYMVKAAKEAARVFDASGARVSVREHKITERDGLGYMKKLSVSAIPSICIDGRECFASLIPDRAELVASIKSASDLKTV
ncbi:MAG: uroporphyrinogen decarboxylase family protein [Terrimicrobiaceae bacterium]